MSDSLTHEAEFWGSCVNTWGEEVKQAEYAKRMGLTVYGTWPRFDLAGRSVLDIGGGPVSILLKTVNAVGTVVDPCPFPDWVTARYAEHDVRVVREPAEMFRERGFDECWIYNVLQHVENPGQVVGAAKEAAATVRVFEWTGIPADDLHPHVLTVERLAAWCDADGRAEFGVNRAWGEASPAMSWAAAFGGRLVP